jgi:hypothetical protein
MIFRISWLHRTQEIHMQKLLIRIAVIVAAMYFSWLALLVFLALLRLVLPWLLLAGLAYLVWRVVTTS